MKTKNNQLHHLPKIPQKLKQKQNKKKKKKEKTKKKRKDRILKKIVSIRFGLVSFFNGRWTFVGYLMPNAYL